SNLPTPSRSTETAMLVSFVERSMLALRVLSAVISFPHYIAWRRSRTACPLCQFLLPVRQAAIRHLQFIDTFLNILTEARFIRRWLTEPVSQQSASRKVRSGFRNRMRVKNS